MKTIRRIYLYAVAFISMEVVLWGLIGLARSIFSDSVGGGVGPLAQALALILVGVPVFGIHWWAVQRSAKKDADEHASGLRAFFFYAALLALLIPVAQNGMAVLNRLLLNAFDLSLSRAVWGGNQSLVDNLIAAAMNALLATYFLSVLRNDWAQVTTKAALTLTRRVYRYIWVFYSLIMSIAGVQQILYYLFSRLAANSAYSSNDSWFVNGLALTLVGVPLWIWAWKTAQDALTDKAERTSLLRLGVLYMLSLSGVIFVLSVSGIVVNALLELLIGSMDSFKEFMREIDEPLSIGIPLGAVWAYYGHWLKRDLATVSDVPRRASMNRLYSYILSLIGLVATFSGVAMLLSFLIDISLGESLWAGSMSTNLTASLATLIVALPLWLLTWRPIQAEALAPDDTGDHARRSIIRKIYLYIAIFAGVVGGMVAAVQLISLLLEALLDAPPRHFTNDLLDSFQLLFLFGGLLAYHWKTLQRDGILLGETLREKTKQFTVILFDTGDETLSSQLASFMDAESEKINLILQNPDEEIPAADAAILPADLALDPPEMLKSWLRTFSGSKIILTNETDDWFWVDNIQQIKKSLRRLAEGEDIQQSQKTQGWMIAVYILAGMMGVQILFFLLMIAFESF